jgi:hypothetical protein
MGSATRNRLYRTIVFVGCLVLLAELYDGWAHHYWFASFPDYENNMGIARNWLANGSYFLPDQLAGPHQWQAGDVLYPPVALWLFVPFSYLPMIAWFAFPFAVIIAAFKKLRPPAWALAIIVILLLYPPALIEITSGNTLIWLMAIEFAALTWHTPISLGLFKPSLFPFLLFGIHTKRWWAAAGLLALLSLPFLQLNFTWAQVILNTQGRSGMLYNIDEFVYLAIPYLAWFSSNRSRSERRNSGQPALQNRHSFLLGLKRNLTSK